MRILIVEDNDERIKVFKWMFEEHDIVITDTAALAIEWITHDKYDVIFLDHDLGGVGNGYMHSEEPNTGYTVAKHIPITVNATTPIVVHSWNPVGAQNIMDYLQYHNIKVVRKQFGMFSKEILKIRDAELEGFNKKLSMGSHSG